MRKIEFNKSRQIILTKSGYPIAYPWEMLGLPSYNIYLEMRRKFNGVNNKNKISKMNKEINKS